MKNKVITFITLATLVISSFSIGASEIEKNTLTLEQATKNAKTMSILLEQNERQAILQGEEADYAFLLYGYDAYKQQNTVRRYTQQQKDVIRKQLERSVRQLFDTILLQQEKLTLLQGEIELQHKLMRQVEIKNELGMASALELEKAHAEYQSLIEEKEQLGQTLYNLSVEFEELTKYSLDKYKLEEIEQGYKEFLFPGSLDALASLRAEEHLDLWMANQQIELQNLPIYTSDYLARLQKEESRLQAEENAKLTKDGLEEAVRTIYINLKQVEDNYFLLLKSLELQQTTLTQQEIYLEKGMISQVQYEKMLLNYDQTRLSVKELLNQYTDLKELLDRPYLISTRGGM